MSIYNYLTFILSHFYIPLSRFYAYIHISVCVVAVRHLPSSFDEGRYEAAREGIGPRGCDGGAADEQLAGRWAGAGGSGAFPNLRQRIRSLKLLAQPSLE